MDGYNHHDWDSVTRMRSAVREWPFLGGALGVHKVFGSCAALPFLRPPLAAQDGVGPARTPHGVTTFPASHLDLTLNQRILESMPLVYAIWATQ